MEGPPPKVERVDKLDDVKRSLSKSMKRNNSNVVLSRPSDLSISRNISSIKQNPSLVITTNPSNPFFQLQQNVSAIRSEVASPTLYKNSRLSNKSTSSGLKIIQETKREITGRESNLSSSRSSVLNK